MALFDSVPISLLAVAIAPLTLVPLIAGIFCIFKGVWHGIVRRALVVHGAPPLPPGQSVVTGVVIALGGLLLSVMGLALTGAELHSPGVLHLDRESFAQMHFAPVTADRVGNSAIYVGLITAGILVICLGVRGLRTRRYFYNGPQRPPITGSGAVLLAVFCIVVGASMVVTGTYLGRDIWISNATGLL